MIASTGVSEDAAGMHGAGGAACDSISVRGMLAPHAAVAHSRGLSMHAVGTFAEYAVTVVRVGDAHHAGVGLEHGNAEHARALRVDDAIDGAAPCDAAHAGSVGADAADCGIQSTVCTQVRPKHYIPGDLCCG